jgi:hypothetical protein
MNTQLTAWVAQVHEATGYLKRLYSGLKDPVQRKRAEASGAYAGERFRSSGRKPQKVQPPWIGLTSSQSERTAWIAVIEGLLGLNLLVALGSASSSKAEPARLHRRLNQELTSAIKGFVAAFPAEMVTQDLHSLCEGVVDQAAGVAEGAWKTVQKEGEESVDVRGFLRQEWLKDIRDQIQGLVDSKG